MAIKFKIPASGLLLVGAVVFGGLAVFAASQYITQTVAREKERLNPKVENATVVVAKENMKRGDIVTTDNMAVRQIPKEYVPGTAVDPDSFDNVEGARLAVDMRRGEVLLRGTLEGADVSTFSTRIPNGERAITLTVDEVNSVAGMLQPNDHVDLFFTAKPVKSSAAGTAQATDQTRLLMQNVDILATGHQVRPSAAGAGNSPSGAARAFTNITIEASPTDVQRLILAQKAGTITAVLRGNADAQSVAANTLDVRELFGSMAVNKSGVRQVVPMTEVIIGGKGDHPERELLQMLSMERQAPQRIAGLAPAASAPATPSTEEVMRDFIKAAAVPMQAGTMAR
jgi:pilus assembly protein CpaB